MKGSIALKELIGVLPEKKIVGNLPEFIQNISYDSRKVGKDYLFVCINGEHVDGHNFARDAKKNGASVILSEREDILRKSKLSGIVVPDTKAALACLANRFYNYPSRELILIGITGTNGKTTTAYLIEAILREKGIPAGLIGTINYRIKDKVLPARQTTPESLDLQKFLREMVNKGVKSCVMEVSSHALALNRVKGCEFDIAIFTNLSQDHLDFHKDFESYLRAKTLLFRQLSEESAKLREKFAIVNIDDAKSHNMIIETGAEIVKYGFNLRSDIYPGIYQSTINGITMEVITPLGKTDIKSPLIGHHNIYNILAAIATGMCLEIELPVIRDAIQKVESIPGRFERIEQGQNFLVVVDYAHTPDALENVLNTARKLTRNNLMVVFGCGGDRDKTKRPIMGEIAARIADYVVLTSDNPRSEDPMGIIKEIEEGMQKVEVPEEKYIIFENRFEAIQHAILRAEKGDTVVIAGKGHELYQIVGKKVHDFDDREVAREILARLPKKPKPKPKPEKKKEKKAKKAKREKKEKEKKPKEKREKKKKDVKKEKKEKIVREEKKAKIEKKKMKEKPKPVPEKKKKIKRVVLKKEEKGKISKKKKVAREKPKKSIKAEKPGKTKKVKKKILRKS